MGQALGLGLSYPLKRLYPRPSQPACLLRHDRPPLRRVGGGAANVGVVVLRDQDRRGGASVVSGDSAVAADPQMQDESVTAKVGIWALARQEFWWRRVILMMRTMNYSDGLLSAQSV